jgi:hypothetical protein
MLVWFALALAGVGYWWHVQRHEVKRDYWTEQDGTDTATTVARLYEKKR